MISFTSLLLPILLASVAVFIASSIIHMATPWHKNDFPSSDKEDAILDALRPINIAPGDYFMPRPRSREDMKSQAFIDKANRGPVVLMTVMPNGLVNIGKAMGGWFIYLIVVNLIVAIVVQQGFQPGMYHGYLFHQCLLVGFAGYALALVQMTIWYKRSLSLTLKALFDGAIYALISALIFTWMWPGTVA